MLAFVSQLQSKNRIPYGLVWLLLIIGCNPSPDSNTGFDTIIEGESTHFKVGESMCTMRLNSSIGQTTRSCRLKPTAVL